MTVKSEKEIMQTWGSRGNPLVTVCCITYNQEKYIEDAIRGFLMQETGFPFEIIIHDDASTDNTANIVRSYAEQYPNIIRTIFQKENQYSQGRDINSFVFDIARGTYLAICEGDDYWTDSQKLQIQATKMQEHPECHISFHAVTETLNNAAESVNLKPYSKHYDKEQVFDPRTVLLGDGCFMQTPSIMLHKDVVKNLPDFYYTAPATDYILKFLGSLNGGALYINRIMGVYRVDAEGSWSETVHQNEEKMMNYLELLVESYMSMNDYLDGKYEKEIMCFVEERYIILANYFYREKKYEKLKKYKDVSIAFQIMYYLRYYPRLLDIIFNINKIIKKMLIRRV